MKRKLFIIFFMLVLLPTLALFYSNYLKTERSAAINVNQAMLQTLKQVDYNVKNTLDNMVRVSDTLFFDNEVKAFVGEENNNDLILQLEQLKNLRNQFYNMERDTGLYKVRIYVDQKKMVSTEHVNFFSLDSIKNLPWYKETADKCGAVDWSSVYLEKDIAGEPDLWLVSCRRVLKHSNNIYDNDGILSVDIKESTLYSFIKDIHLRKSEQVFIVDRDGKMIAGRDESKLGKTVIEASVLGQINKSDRGILEPKITNTEEYLIYTTIENTGWKIVDRIGQKYILENYSFLGDMQFVLLSILVLLLFVAASFVIINNLTKELITRMNRIAEKIENEGIQAKGQEYDKINKSDELGKVEKLVYEMIQRSKELAEESYKVKLEERKAQLMALQAQINPHFLYNTLECINWMAIRKNALDISALVTKLAKYFRLTLNKGKSIVGIEDEIELAKIYLAIQNTRFDNAIQFEVNMDSEIVKYNIPKLTLQPIMENAVLHGIMKKPEKKGNLTITAKVYKDDILIIIEDDGVGIEDEKLRDLLSKQQSEHYGLFNVEERIKLYFGESYGISIQSEIEKGTKVTLRIGKMI
ncbi:cache domain-containing sensor histidine kinase [Anaerocolumna sp. MB42-C2]|uniref:cache domain-containing sensor histidine kinase n=1 Tax=Anaerocolumna sp. MB42-C2 TaxID=3070997 RepID=UPI0027DEC8C4|nr:sensor histidine kinase [Anaerocolumna sp. MB42-C2]WMJ85613.1 sensor histidine kinase [Anaerocolumna sp. MB42-C2]